MNQAQGFEKYLGETKGEFPRMLHNKGEFPKIEAITAPYLGNNT